MSSYPLNSTKTNSITSTLSKKESMRPFYLILFYLFLEYGRPQAILPFLSYLHLPAVTIVLLGLSGFFSGRFKWDDKQTKLYLVLLGLMVIHGPIAVNNFWTLMIFIAMSLNFIVYLSMSNVIDNQEKYKKLVNAWFFIHIFLSVVGIKNMGRGVGGFLGDENDLCMTLNMILPFSFFLALYESGKKRTFYIVITCLFLFVIILTQSRGGFVGLGATTIYCWIRTKRKALTALIVGLLAVFVVLVAPQTYWDQVRSITEEGITTGTGEERVYTWGVGWHMFLDNPIMGVGQGNFPFVFRKYEVEAGHGEEGYHGRSVAGRAAHSIYFTLLPELGLIGTFLFISMVLSNIKDLNVIKKISRTHKNTTAGDQTTRFYYIAMALEGSLISYLASGVFISTLYYPNFWILMGFIISLKKILISNTKSFQALSPS
jgi:O-antigen ligase